jgi:hypothetical protein
LTYGSLTRRFTPSDDTRWATDRPRIPNPTIPSVWFESRRSGRVFSYCPLPAEKNGGDVFHPPPDINRSYCVIRRAKFNKSAMTWTAISSVQYVGAFATYVPFAVAASTLM